MKKLFIIAALLLSGCPKPVPEPTPPPQPIEDGGAEDAQPATCAGACARWAELGCKEAEPERPGHCEAVCENLVNSGVVTLNLTCRASVKSCKDIDACER